MAEPCLAEPVAVSAGDEVAVRFDAHLVGDDYVWQWSTKVLAQGDPLRVKAAFRQSTLDGVPLSLDRLQKREAGHVPALTEDGEIDRLILSLVDGAAPARDRRTGGGEVSGAVRSLGGGLDPGGRRGRSLRALSRRIRSRIRRPRPGPRGPADRSSRLPIEAVVWRRSSPRAATPPGGAAIGASRPCHPDLALARHERASPEPPRARRSPFALRPAGCPGTFGAGRWR